MVKKTKNNEILVSAEGNDIPMMAEIETLPVDNATDDLTGELPVMPLRNLMIFPSIVMPVSMAELGSPWLSLLNLSISSRMMTGFDVSALIRLLMIRPGMAPMYVLR